MKILLKPLLAFCCLLFFACSTEDYSSEPPEIENAVFATANACTLTSLIVNNDQITVNTNGNAYEYIAIHRANYSQVEVLCYNWTGPEPTCDSGNLTSSSLSVGDYLLKVVYGSGNNDFCWKPFSILPMGECETSAPFTIQGNQLSVTPSASVIRLSVHNSTYGYISDLCDYWSGGAPPCNGTLTTTLASGSYFLRIQDGQGSGDFCFVSFSID